MQIDGREDIRRRQGDDVESSAKDNAAPSVLGRQAELLGRGGEELLQNLE